MHGFYINLNRRTDRRELVEEEFKRIGLEVERFPAVEYTPGAIGCNLSHIEVLKLAKSRGYESVMIFEDDFEFLISKEEWNQQISRLPTSYDVVMLSYNLVQSTPHDETFLRVQEVQTTSGYIVHSRFYDTLIARWEEGTRLFKENPKVDWIYILDQYWKALQPGAEWYAFKQRIGQQRAGFSDLAGQFVEYRC
jgi:GR25 family glycosyltransferase involved in LPS biosynthesis